MRQLAEGVNLIHELRQLRRSEEFLYRRCYGSYIDKGLRRDNVEILCRHSFAYNTLHTRQTDSELVLQKLAHAAQSAVAEVVDVINRAYARVKVAYI